MGVPIFYGTVSLKIDHLMNHLKVTLLTSSISVSEFIQNLVCSRENKIGSVCTFSYRKTFLPFQICHINIEKRALLLSSSIVFMKHKLTQSLISVCIESLILRSTLLPNQLSFTQDKQKECICTLFLQLHISDMHKNSYNSS